MVIADCPRKKVRRDEKVFNRRAWSVLTVHDWFDDSANR